MRLFLRLKIACQNAHISRIYLTDSSLKWYFCQAHFMLFVLKPKQGKITLRISPWSE